MATLPYPKGILFDRGGVLVQPRDRQAHQSVPKLYADWMAQHYRLDATRWLEALREPTIGYDTGRLCARERLRATANRYGWDVKDHEMQRIINAESTFLYAQSRLDPDIHVLDQLKKMGLAIGLCSNASPLEEGCDRMLGLMSYVSDRGYSHHLGAKKPDPRAYETAAARLGFRPDELWFVDDGADGSLQGAAAVGLTAIYYEHPDAVGVLRPELVAGFTGPVIGRLNDLVALLQAASA